MLTTTFLFRSDALPNGIGILCKWVVVYPGISALRAAIGSWLLVGATFPFVAILVQDVCDTKSSLDQKNVIQ